jgi:hypothetical protein
MMSERVNTLQNYTMVREEVDAHQRAYSQVKCAIVDSINRKEVQHIVCASGRPGVNIATTFRSAWHERTSDSEMERGFSRQYKPFQW